MTDAEICGTILIVLSALTLIIVPFFCSPEMKEN